MTTASTLDRETRAAYQLVVSVSDSGVPSRTVSFLSYMVTYFTVPCFLYQSTAMVSITVLDENDHTPQCSQPLFTFSTEEDNDNRVFLGVVSATDGDTDVRSGQLTYQLSSSALQDTIVVSPDVSVFMYVSCMNASVI